MSVATLLLEARGIGRLHRDGSSWLIRDVTLEIRAGDRIALAGPTGSGKTVLLRALAMLDAVDEGEVIWQGNRPAADEVPQYRSQVIYLTQRACLVDGTVERNLQLPYSLATHRDREYSRERVVAALDRLGRKESFLGRESANLSGGETQIVALLRAIQLAPRIVLLDEPTASLDETTARQIEQFVADWMSQASTQPAFIWVTHDAAQASRVANRTLQIQGGTLA